MSNAPHAEESPAMIYTASINGSTLHLAASHASTRTLCERVIGELWIEAASVPGGRKVCRSCARAAEKGVTHANGEQIAPEVVEAPVVDKVAPTTLRASDVTRLCRSRGIYVFSHTRSSGAVRVVPVTDDNPTAARQVRNLLIAAGYEATLTQLGEQPGDAVLVVLPEPTADEPAPGAVHPARVCRSQTVGCDDRSCGLVIGHPIPDAVVEADVPPTVDERVTVRIRARELRAGDLAVGPTGFVAFAVFDTDAGTQIADGRLVRVWTAIRDQERGLPPVITVPAERELLVLRPVSEEGREILAALDRS